MKILLINQTFYPDVSATAQHSTDFCEHLTLKGHQVTVLAGRRSYLQPKVVFLPSEDYKGTTVKRISNFDVDRHNRLSRVCDTLFFNLCAAWELLWMPRFDVVIALTSPPMIGSIASFFSKIKKEKLICWILDLNPDQVIEIGWIRQKSIQAMVLNAGLKLSLNCSKSIIALDTYMKERIENKGVSGSKIMVIPPWPHEDLTVCDAEGKNADFFRRKHGVENKFIVMYSGNHSICHPLDTLLEAAKELKDQENILFLFIGGGSRVKDVLDFKAKYSLKNIQYLSYVERNEVKYSLVAANIHIVTMGNPFVGIVHPCKIYNILNTGKPFIFIGPKRSHIGDIVQESGVGIQVENGETQKLVECILEIENKKDHTWIIENSRRQQEFAKKYNQKKLLEKMEQVVLSP